MAGESQFDFWGGRHAPVADRQIDAEDRPRLTAQCQAVLERLQAGPATNMDLIPISTRFSARIHELRKHGYRIDTEKNTPSRGLTTYTLLK